MSSKRLRHIGDHDTQPKITNSPSHSTASLPVNEDPTFDLYDTFRNDRPQGALFLSIEQPCCINYLPQKKEWYSRGITLREKS